mmetsp:Transcript_19409/g.50955  ORF Transcript_19409/g.50955 Transcript_19409/m.50955 type:complete len:242 (-) Transcript_19409:408-1133(-)
MSRVSPLLPVCVCVPATARTEPRVFHLHWHSGCSLVSMITGSGSSVPRVICTRPLLKAMARVGAVTSTWPSAPSYQLIPTISTASLPSPSPSSLPGRLRRLILLPMASYAHTCASWVTNRMYRQSGDHSTKINCISSSLPHRRLPSTLPTITAPSAYTMQILEPSAVHFISFTTDLLRLLIISSNHIPLCSIHTIMSPLSSEVVSFRYSAFQVTHTTLPWCPSSVWFMLRLDGAATPVLAF